MIKDMRKRLENGETIHVQTPNNRLLFDIVPLQGDAGYSSYTVHLNGEPVIPASAIDGSVDAWSLVICEQAFDELADEEENGLEAEWQSDYYADIASGVCRPAYF